MEKIDELEGAFNTKFDTINTTLADFTSKMDRLLEAAKPLRIPGPVLQVAPQPRARRVPLPREEQQGSTAAAAAHVVADDMAAEDDGYAEDGEFPEQPPGRPRAHPRNYRPQPQVRDDEHVAKLKLTIPPFEGRYNPDAYLTWELEVEQRFACLNYPEDRRVCAATCEFTGFASVWWSEHCHMYHHNIPNTWDA